MPSRSDLEMLYRIGSQLGPAIHEPQNWPYDVPHAQYEASLWPPHDGGGSPTRRSARKTRKRNSGSSTPTSRARFSPGGVRGTPRNGAVAATTI